MALKQLQCPNCGGPLIANDNYTFFTCKSCQISFDDIERDDAKKKEDQKLRDHELDNKIELGVIIVGGIAVLIFIAVLWGFIIYKEINGGM